MTKQQFIDYVAKFKKNPGEFTRDEIYLIGTYHKTLPQADKSWDWVKDITGWEGTKESLRSFIKDSHRRDMKGLQPAEPSKESAEEDSYREKIESLYKEKIKIRDYRNDFNKDLRVEARLEELKDVMIEAAKALPELPLIKCDRSLASSKQSSAILVLSDWHIGQVSDNFYNKYDETIAKERLKLIIKKAIKYCSYHKVSTLHVLNLGDLIEGYINLDARIQQTRDVCDQVMLSAEYMAEALAELQQAAPVITYRSVLDNHARFHQDKKQAIPSENFNRLVDWFIKERLKGSHIQFMDDNLSPTFGRFALENGMKVAFAHGHEPKDRKEHTLQTMVGALREWTDVVIYGHLHNPAEHVYQNMRVFYNGSLCGVGTYPMSLGLFTEPSQKLLIFDNKDFLNLDLSALD